MGGDLRRKWYFFWCKEVAHPFSGRRLYQYEPRVEVTNFLLTHEGTRSRMPFACTPCSRREYTTEPILAEPHA